MATGKARIERGGWSLLLPPASAELPARLGLELIDLALKIASGAGGEPLRRSRHASTYQVRLGTPFAGETEVFVKLLDAPRGLKSVLRLAKHSRAERMQAIPKAPSARARSHPTATPRGIRLPPRYASDLSQGPAPLRIRRKSRPSHVTRSAQPD